MAGTTIRRLKIIELLSAQPGKKFSVLQLQNKLNSEGIQVSVRTLQRDLVALLDDKRISADQKIPQGWKWESNETWLEAIRLDAHTALALMLSKEQLQRLLPVSSWKSLTPILRKAEETLAELSNTGSVGSWLDRIAVMPWGPPLVAPDLDPAIHEIVTQAVLEGKQLEVWYRSAGKRQSKKHKVNPLGLVYREQVLYLVTTEYQGIPEEEEDEEGKEKEEQASRSRMEDIEFRLLALHRIQTARPIPTPRVEPKGFLLRDYVSNYVFSDPWAEEIELKFRIHRDAGQFLLETPLSQDQTLEAKRKWIYVTATVQRTWQLVWWLKSFGSAVEVISPQDIRRGFVEMTRELGRYYLRGR